MTSPADRIDRTRILRKVLCADWNGTGMTSMEVKEHSGQAQHQLSINFDVPPTAGVLVVEGRPVGADFFVTVGERLKQISVVDTGSIAIPFSGFFDAIRLRFSS